jgi:hypothetical protein
MALNKVVAIVGIVSGAVENLTQLFHRMIG